jgi:hypothetical protein
MPNPFQKLAQQTASASQRKPAESSANPEKPASTQQAAEPIAEKTPETTPEPTLEQRAAPAPVQSQAPDEPEQPIEQPGELAAADEASAAAIAATLINKSSVSSAEAIQAQPDVPSGVSVYVIESYSDPRFNPILRGTVGRLNGEHFHIDPSYRNIDLFSALQNQLSASGLSLREVKLPDEQVAKEFAINMLIANNESWAQLYKAMITPGDSAMASIATAMMENDKRKTKEVVEREVEGSNLATHDVGVTYTSTAGDDQIFGDVPKDLDLAREGQISNIVISPGAAPQEQALDISDEVTNHNGPIVMTVSGSAQVMASSPENAQKIFSTMAPILQDLHDRNVLKVTPARVEEIVLAPRDVESDSDYGYSSYERQR